MAVVVVKLLFRPADLAVVTPPAAAFDANMIFFGLLIFFFFSFALARKPVYLQYDQVSVSKLTKQTKSCLFLCRILIEMVFDVLYIFIHIKLHVS